ncbi:MULTISPECIES: mechanosensitive ion channel family protein [unclassified Haloparvum]|uniref:mechanosensitive ion channel family protein n=1 Tax=Haloparvum sp. PAK95 TaxID=3418962 RepID=UPI003D2F4B84
MSRTEREGESVLGWTAIVLVTFGLIGLLGYVLQFFLSERFTTVFTDVYTTVVVLAATFLVSRAFGHLLTLLQRASPLSLHQREVFYRVFQLVTFGGVSVVLVIYVWDIAVTNVLLGAGLTSVILALAARQTLSSVFAGITLISTSVFRVGDWVKIDQRFGQITQISLFNTMVRSPQGETHVFPNDDIIARDITNLGKGRYRNDVLIGVDYETDIDHVRAVCDDVLEDLTTDDGNNVDGYHPTTVKDFDESQITLSVKMWVAEPRPMAINSAQTTVFTNLQDRFADERITIPFPQRTISEREPVGDSEPS